MAAKKRGLGRGLDSLLGVARTPVKTSEAGHEGTSPSVEAEEKLQWIAVDLLQRGQYQPRSHMQADALKELSDSIRVQGVVQALIARPIAEGRFELIAGERRWRAAQMAGLEKVPVIVRDIPDQATLAMSLVENIQREDLNPLEESSALRRLMEEFSLTHQEVAEIVGKSRSSVSNLLRLQELNADVKRLLEQRELEMGHARALLAIKGAKQSDIALQVVAQQLSVRDAEQLIRRLLEPPAIKKNAPNRPADPDVRRLQEDLKDRLGAQVKIVHNPKGKGKLEIRYNSLDELDGILEHIR